MTDNKKATHFVINRFVTEEFQNSLGYSWVLDEYDMNYPRHVIGDEATLSQIVTLLNGRVKREATNKIEDDLRKLRVEKDRLEEVKTAVETLTDTQKKLFGAFMDFDKMFDKRSYEELERKEKKLTDKLERVRSGNYDQNVPDVTEKFEFESIVFESSVDVLRTLY